MTIASEVEKTDEQKMFVLSTVPSPAHFPFNPGTLACRPGSAGKFDAKFIRCKRDSRVTDNSIGMTLAPDKPTALANLSGLLIQFYPVDTK